MRGELYEFAPALKRICACFSQKMERKGKVLPLPEPK